MKLSFERSVAGRRGVVIPKTAVPFAKLDDALLRAILDRHPPERVLFGSDYPIFDPARELARLRERLAVR